MQGIITPKKALVREIHQVLPRSLLPLQLQAPQMDAQSTARRRSLKRAVPSKAAGGADWIKARFTVPRCLVELTRRSARRCRPSSS